MRVERIEVGQDGEAPDEFGDQTEAPQVGGGDGGQQRLGTVFSAGVEADARCGDAAFDVLLDAAEGTSANEEDVARVERDELLFRVLAASLRRDVDFRTFE